MTRSLSGARPMRTAVRVGSGRTVVGRRKVPVRDGVDTEDGLETAGPPFGTGPRHRARGPSEALPKRSSLPTPMLHSWTRWPSTQVPLVLCSSSTVQWSPSGRRIAWCQETRASSRQISHRGSRPTWYVRPGLIAVEPVSVSRTSSGAVGTPGRWTMSRFSHDPTGPA